MATFASGGGLFGRSNYTGPSRTLQELVDLYIKTDLEEETKAPYPSQHRWIEILHSKHCSGGKPGTPMDSSCKCEVICIVRSVDPDTCEPGEPIRAYDAYGAKLDTHTATGMSESAEDYRTAHERIKARLYRRDK